MHLRSGRILGSDEKRRRALATAIPDDLLIHEVLVHLPDDLLIHEVLVCLPAKSLARFRCVCRSWRAGIAVAAFVRRHLELSRSRPPNVLAVPREVDLHDAYVTTGEISFHRLLLPPPEEAPTGTPTIDTELILEKAWPDGITRRIIPTHCDGLVAIATATDSVFVCNPATREFVALPHVSHNELIDHSDMLVLPVALGFDQWRNCYVVARCFYRNSGEEWFDEATGAWTQDCTVGHEVFMLSAGGGDSWELTEVPPYAAGVQRPVCTPRAFY